MRRRLTWVAVLVLGSSLVLLWLTGGEEPVPAPGPGTVTAAPGSGGPRVTEAPRPRWARVSGRVLREGAPAPGARVTLRGAAPVVAIADAAGAFSFTEVSPGAVLLSAVADGAASEIVGPLEVAPEQSLDGVLLVLQPSVRVHGVIVDLLTRAPVPRATVLSPQKAVATDAEGHFELEGPRGTTWIDVIAPGYLGRTEWISLALATSGGRLEIVLTPVSRLEGSVLEAGAPAGGSTVWAELLDGARRGDRTSTVFTDVDGGFRLEGAGGLLRLSAVTPRGTRITGPLVRLAVGETRTGLVLEGREASWVDGVVAAADGAPVAGAQLWAIHAATEEIAAVATSGPDGRFRFDSVESGRYLVQVRAVGLTAIAGPFEQTGDGRVWTVTVTTGARLWGRVEPPAPGVKVRWRSGSWAGPAAETVTDAEGRFSFDGLPDEWVSLDAESAEGAATTRARPGQEVVLRLSHGEVTVYLTDDTGAPVTDGVLLSRSVETGATRRQLVLAPDGVTRVPLPLGRWELVLEVAGKGRSATVPITVAGAPLEVRISLESSVTVRGVVRDAQTQLPVTGAVVEAFSGTDFNPYRLSVASDARGQFVLPPTPRSARLMARRDGYRPAFRAAAEGSTWNVTLQRSPRPESSPPAFQFEGVGMGLDNRSGEVLVASVNPGGPAERAGVQPGDAIIAIEGRPTAGLPLDQVVGQIRGPSGTAVRLLFRRQGQDFELSLRRRQLSL